MLTYPNTWGTAGRRTLVKAAGRVGWGQVGRVSEPVAAAVAFAAVHGACLPIRACALVYDLGAVAGTSAQPEPAGQVVGTNVVNGWLADNPEKHAKQLVFSEGTCIQYEVTCAFNRKALDLKHKLAAVVENLVPSGITVKVTPLRSANGDKTNWATYTPDATATKPFTVPADVLAMTPM